ncbi:MAG TPA: PilZ domain-containing protein [Nitrospiraceae bacterium]|nr:PilZ domain-containing protein [Nitrospiraceae bacterium]
MAKTAVFKGYTIQSRSFYDTNWGKWQVRIVISSDSQHGIRTRDFSSMVLYATEEEADLHGITFGEHLIEGKVEGQSVHDLKPMDRRATPRPRVQFRTTFVDASRVERVGLISDLSWDGCRIESSAIVEPGVSMELLIHVPHLDWPIVIETASVQWASGSMFGLAFFRITEPERQRLGQVISKLLEG